MNPIPPIALDDENELKNHLLSAAISFAQTGDWEFPYPIWSRVKKKLDEREALARQAGAKEERTALLAQFEEMIGEDDFVNPAIESCDDPDCDCKSESLEYLMNQLRAEQRQKLNQLREV